MSLRRLSNVLRALHRDQRGAVSLETILIIGAIALPILIFLIRIAWPMIKGMMVHNLDVLESTSNPGIN